MNSVGPKGQSILLKDTDIVVSTNTSDKSKMLSSDTSSYWESKGSRSWVEIKAPAEFVVTGLDMYSNDHGSYSPKNVTVSVVSFKDAQAHRLTASSKAPAATIQGCDSSCSESHSSDALCLVCGKDWGGSHGGHTCRGGKRGSFVNSQTSSAEKPFSESCALTHSYMDRDIPKDAKTYVPLLTLGDCVLHDPAIIRIQINSNHGGGGSSKISSLKLNGYKRKIEPWGCVVCLGYNVDFMKCEVRH